jgi:DNA-binding IclR family transcriptional regulator
METQQPGAPVLKALSVLRFIAENKAGVGLQEAASNLDMSISTAHRLLRLLVSQDLLSYEGHTRLYGAGPELLRLAAMVMQNFSMSTAIRQVMRSLMQECNETACLAAYMPLQGMMAFLAIEECNHPLRYVIEIGTLQSLHVGASGKAILAYLPAEEIERLLQPEADSPRILGELEEVRRNGYAFSRGERIPEAAAVAAPIINSRGQVVGDLMVTLPSSRYSEGQVHELAPRVIEHARRLSVLLGPGSLDQQL